MNKEKRDRLERAAEAACRFMDMDDLKGENPARAVKGIGTQRAVAILKQQMPHCPPIIEHPHGIVWPGLGGLPLCINEAMPEGEVWLLDADGHALAKVTGLE